MERRRFSRPTMRLNVRASGQVGPIGHLLNVTDTGACLSGKGVPPTETTTLELSLPVPLAGHRSLSVTAEPRWHDYLPNGHWRCGMHFHADQETAEVLTLLASRYGESRH